MPNSIFDIPTVRTAHGRPGAKCLCLDIETARTDQTVLKEIGAYRPDTDTRDRIAGKARDLQPRLDRITHGASFVLGHNIVAFDQPALALLHPGLALHQLPLVDTLELSPIAFPQNPYHRLVKDYKLCSTVRNDPVRDAELAYELFVDQRDALRTRLENQADEMLCLHYLLAPTNGKGVANLFASLRHALRPELTEVQAAWERATTGKVCQTAQRTVVSTLLGDPHWFKPLAYALAWLRVSGANSVLPPWVGHAFPETRHVIAQLRDMPCQDPICQWCAEQHDLTQVLPRYFPGITRFRSTPATADGRSLQQTIVQNGFGGIPTLAILPTGGGKSLCYQLPALSRYYRNGSLTVIVSPLQSLMKDQVDNLEHRGITCAGYLNSLLTPLERRAVLEKLRLGDLGLIFVAPEQFRSTAFANALQHREIGAWIFDEAHCLSKWGHDFRPDYLYVSRFIRNKQKKSPSPLFCFTATAKPDVVEDIRAHFKKQLGVELEVLAGGVRRDNLAYEVRPVPAQSKYPEVLRLLQDALKEEGGAIVFCARQKTVEELSKFLRESGLDCGYFHGGMLPTEKRHVQEAFLSGALRVIAATNAFGMGVDKPDVRLVIHLDTPGSLENYLQEAGRAGRDQDPARCILLYDEGDLEVQFRLIKRSRLSQHDIQSILRALRQIEKKDRSEGSVVVTSGEILLEIPEATQIDPEATDADTKVRIAVAWLEEARLLQRHENHTRVFPGSLQISDLAEAETALRKKLGAETDIQPYLTILSLLMQAGDDEGLSTDELMIATGLDSKVLQARLRDLDRFRLLSNDTEIGVTLYPDPPTTDRLNELERLENALVACLRVEAPDADRETWQVLNVRRLCDSLRRDSGVEVDPDRLSRLLKSFAEPFGGEAGQRGFFALRPHGAENRYIRLLWSWQDIEQIRRRRMRLAKALVSHFLGLRQGNQTLIICRQGELESHLMADITLGDLQVQNWGVALSASLIYLDTNEVLHLARGKAVFRSAMTIALEADSRRRRFNKSDYAELDLHYKDKIVQVHVMAEYARLALGKVRAAMAFIEDYFHLERGKFVRKYFTGRHDVLEMATTEVSQRRILTDLHNPEQQAIVAAPAMGNILVLAGPGSGKTRVIVHRVGWLLRVGMVLPEEILVLAYNRSAAVEIRRRLWALVGGDAGGVTVQTLHGMALRLTGTSYAVAQERGETIDFDAVIKEATHLLRTANTTEDPNSSTRRDRVLSGLRYILVDEYQDINGDHYELISTLVGRTLANEEDKLSLMVVGDDDQNIYAFAGANVRYIRQYEQDYQARRHHLLENYRSTQQIITASNAVIAGARDRMKAETPLRIDHARREEVPGGRAEERDPLTRGQLHILETPLEPTRAAQAVVAELRRLHALEADKYPGQWGRFTVIGRQWSDLDAVVLHCRQQGIPVRTLRDEGMPDLHQTREGDTLLALLRREFRALKKPRTILRGRTLSRWFRMRYRVAVADLITHPARAALAQFISDVESDDPRTDHVVQDLIEALYEFGSTGRAISTSQVNGPLVVMTAHRAKGLEFDHVAVLDGGHWKDADDAERRLFYVAMTRAKQMLTLCHSRGGGHAFISALKNHALRTDARNHYADAALSHTTWMATQADVVLSWPGYFSGKASIHGAISNLDIGDALQLQPRSDGKVGWELADMRGTVVGRMAQKFSPPNGTLVGVRVASIVVRKAKGDEVEKLRCASWELILPEIEVC